MCGTVPAVRHVVNTGQQSPSPFASQGSVYAEQRRLNFRNLRFTRGLEAEYRRQMRMEQRGSARICMITALLIWLFFLFADLERLDLRSELAFGGYDALVALAMRVSTLLLLLALPVVLFTDYLPRGYNRLTFVALIMIGTTAAINANVYKLRDMAQADLAQFVIIMAVFLPMGLTFLQSLSAALLIAVINAVAGLVMLDGYHMAEHLRLSVLLFFAVFVGAVGAYLREYTMRDNFLLSRLLHHHAMIDALTGIPNRRGFEEHVGMALRQARRDRVPVAFAVLDVDHFKRYNDLHGHQAGDLALRLLAGTMAGQLRRPMDMVGRLGGEEFGLLLYDSAPDDALRVLEGVVAAVATLAIPHDASPTAPYVTVSIGAVAFNGAETADDLYRRADAALYDGKSAGRNRVEIG